VIIGGVVFGVFAGIAYWFPKAFGVRLDPFWGKVSFWFWVVGFYFAFMPLYVLGLMGVTRRLRVFDDPSLQIWFIAAAFGALLILFGVLASLIQFYVTFRNRDALRDNTGDPWDGRTLEWSTSSPPPAYNFAFTPIVHGLDAWHAMKRHAVPRPTGGFNAIQMPSNTATGVILSALSLAFGLAMIWHMWWLAALSLALIVLGAIGHSFNYTRFETLPAADIAAMEDERTRLLTSKS
jgi:cytochrome o ubiquinol oxidase subunit 1